MSLERTEMFRAVIDAGNRRDWLTASRFLHPEVEYHTYVMAPEPGVYVGPDAVVRYLEELFENFERVEHDLAEVIDSGDQVVAVLDQRAWHRGSTEPVVQRVAELWTIRDELLAERHSFATKAEALEAAGRQRLRQAK